MLSSRRMLAIVALVALFSGIGLGARNAQAATRAYLNLYSLLDGSPSPESTNILERVLTDCGTGNCLGEFYYKVEVQWSDDSGCAFGCGGCSADCHTDVYDGVESLQDGTGRVPVNPGDKDIDCPIDQDLITAFVDNGTTYDYLRYRVTVIDQSPDGDELYRCCTEGGGITQVSLPTMKTTDWYTRTAGSSSKKLWHNFGPGGVDCTIY